MNVMNDTVMNISSNTSEMFQSILNILRRCWNFATKMWKAAIC